MRMTFGPPQDLTKDNPERAREAQEASDRG